MKVLFLRHSTSCLYVSASLVVKRTTGGMLNTKGLNIENLCFRKSLEGPAGQAIVWAPSAFWTVSGWSQEWVQDLMSSCLHLPSRPSTVSSRAHVASCHLCTWPEPGKPLKTPPSPLLATNSSPRKISVSQLSWTSQALESKWAEWGLLQILVSRGIFFFLGNELQCSSLQSPQRLPGADGDPSGQFFLKTCICHCKNVGN